MSLSVLISGVGIAGPTLAYWLREWGYRPTLIERAAAPRTDGYIIDFWGLGYELAERMGLLPALAEQGYHVRELRFVDDRGCCISGFGIDIFHTLTGGRYVSLPRSLLAKLIFERIEGRCEAIFGDSIASLVQSGDGVDVTFERSAGRRFDLVIGADGLHSAVRGLVFGSETQFQKYLGYMFAAFEAEAYWPRDEDVYVAYGAPGKQAGRFVMRDGRTLFLLVFAEDQPLPLEADNKAMQKKILHEAFDGAGWECEKILAALDVSDEIYIDQVCQIRMPYWSRGRVALVGDAAFAPSLLAGQGSALAMIGAYVLAGELARNGTQPETAFERYEHRLRGFMTAKQNAAKGFALSFAPKTRLGLFFRNQVMKAFVISGLARAVIGPGLLDRIDVPDYSKDLDPA
ncbi:MAG TPA: FAD-binding domain [Methylocella sp.]|nr:FAD-binding domain [Methylocella sp.]